MRAPSCVGTMLRELKNCCSISRWYEDESCEYCNTKEVNAREKHVFRRELHYYSSRIHSTFCRAPFEVLLYHRDCLTVCSSIHIACYVRCICDMVTRPSSTATVTVFVTGPAAIGCWSADGAVVIVSNRGFENPSLGGIIDGGLIASRELSSRSGTLLVCFPGSILLMTSQVGGLPSR